MNRFKENWKSITSKIIFILYAILITAIVLVVFAIMIWLFDDDEMSKYAAFLLIAIPVAFWLGKK